MLTSLCIENFAIVSRLELDFAQGMTAFTGETGAGKSIMIDALMLALGERADASVIRSGAEKCDITASFDIDPVSFPADWLTRHDISHEGEIFLRRVVYAEGRSKSYINGQPFPLQKIKELSEMLVDIHGQHQHQTLLQHPTHRQQLDQYANHQQIVDEVYRLYNECLRVKNELERLQNKTSSGEQMLFLQQQIDELNNLALREGEMQELHEEHQLLHHVCDYLAGTQQIIELLNGDDVVTIRRGLNQILQLLSSFPQENAHIKNTTDLLNNALIQCDEALDEMNTFSGQVLLDPLRLQAVEERISQLHQTARKYHVESNQLPAYSLQLEKELKQLHDTEQEQYKLQQQYNEYVKSYENAAQTLRASRQTYAKKLEDEITRIIRQLGMPQGFITIDITPLDKMQPHGLDRVEYKVCTNPGMPADALGKIASGGELSRIGLAIHIITAQQGATPTLLFDEVDVGIGGATAALVGQLLRDLGKRLQVFCVTHQPQVASCAHHHFMVEKECKDNQTFSRIIPLVESEKIDEIARMLGGLTITEQTRSHAQELLVQSH